MQSRLRCSRSTTWSCSSGMGVAHISHRSPGGALDRPGAPDALEDAEARRGAWTALSAVMPRHGEGPRPAVSGTPQPVAGSNVCGGGPGLRPSSTNVVGGCRGSFDGSSTSKMAISGAASAMARSTAIRSVTAEDGQPSQLPSSRRWTAPTTASMSSSSTSPPCAPRNGRTDSRAAAPGPAGRRGGGRAPRAGCRPARRRRAGASGRERRPRPARRRGPGRRRTAR